MTTSIFSESWCGIVFDGRNQNYGAYELRKSTERNILIAILFSVSLLSIGINVMLLKGDPNKSFIPLIDEEEEEDDTRVLEYILPQIPEDEPESEQAEFEPGRAFTATETFSTIELVVDSTAAIDTVISQDSFGEKQPGTTDQAGDSTATASTETTTGAGSGQSTQKIVDWAEVMPEFPGGIDALLKYIHDNTVYPEIAVRNDIEGTVHIQFIVDRDGSLTDVRLARKNFKCLDDEALRVVQSMPKWKPGMQNGELVPVRFAVPIRFVLD